MPEFVPEPGVELFIVVHELLEAVAGTRDATLRGYSDGIEVMLRHEFDLPTFPVVIRIKTEDRIDMVWRTSTGLTYRHQILWTGCDLSPAEDLTEELASRVMRRLLLVDNWEAVTL